MWSMGIDGREVAIPASGRHAVAAASHRTRKEAAAPGPDDRGPVEADVLEIGRLVVDAARRRGDPVGELAGLVTRPISEVT